jgi:hypothetical protein
MATSAVVSSQATASSTAAFNSSNSSYGVKPELSYGAVTGIIMGIIISLVILLLLCSCCLPSTSHMDEKPSTPELLLICLRGDRGVSARRHKPVRIPREDISKGSIPTKMKLRDALDSQGRGNPPSLFPRTLSYPLAPVRAVVEPHHYLDSEADTEDFTQMKQRDALDSQGRGNPPSLFPRTSSYPLAPVRAAVEPHHYLNSEADTEDFIQMTRHNHGRG